MDNLFAWAGHCLACANIADKLQQLQALGQAMATQSLVLTPIPCHPVQQPGRPSRPELVAPRQLPRRKLTTPLGHAALIHAIAHIEFNAINIALDAMHRFQSMPVAYYQDWLRVAQEEAKHFQLLQEHLASLGYAYGDFAAHDGLWGMCEQTAEDVLERMALVPRVLEARGLDANPGIMRRLAAIGDQAGVAILQVILEDEVGHVAVGNRWYAYLCQQRGVEPLSRFKQLIASHLHGPLRGPFNLKARREAGFSELELQMLQQLADGLAQQEG